MDNLNRAQVWIYALVFMAVITMCWFMLYQVVYQVVSACRSLIPEENIMAQNVVGLLENVWNWFPIITVFGTILVLFVYTQRKTAESRRFE